MIMFVCNFLSEKFLVYGNKNCEEITGAGFRPSKTRPASLCRVQKHSTKSLFSWSLNKGSNMREENTSIRERQAIQFVPGSTWFNFPAALVNS